MRHGAFCMLRESGHHDTQLLFALPKPVPVQVSTYTLLFVTSRAQLRASAEWLASTKKGLARKSGYRNSMQLEEQERERKCGGGGDEGGGGDGRRGRSGERVAAAVPKEVTAAAYSASAGSEEEESEEAEEKVNTFFQS